MSAREATFYDVLQCEADASMATLKRSYQTLLLRHHPDKRMQKNLTDDEKGADVSELTVQKIDEAWKVLRDPEQRRAYDAEMQQRKYNEKPIVHAVLAPNEFALDPISGAYSHGCRCGGTFLVPDELVAERGVQCDAGEDVFIGCDECSLVVQLTSGES